MRVYFRVDSASFMGSGHLVRCMTLAEALRERGVGVHFICREHTGNMMTLLNQKGFPVTAMPAPKKTVSHGEGHSAWLTVTQEEDAAQTIEAFREEKPDWLVVDHYGIDIAWENQVRPHIGKLMVIDDLANRNHNCDLLLDQNYSVHGEQRYNGLVPPHCNVLMGPKYALLRKEFAEKRERLGLRSYELRNILIFFTAGDDQGETLKAMKAIELFGKAERVDVVVGASTPDRTRVSQKCDELGWGYHCQVDYMATLIAQADLVVGAGGSSNWERCALGVPALIAILADNQAPIAIALDTAGVVINLGWSCELQVQDYVKALGTLNHARLAALSKNALDLVDAKGTVRIVEDLMATQTIH